MKLRTTQFLLQRVYHDHADMHIDASDFEEAYIKYYAYSGYLSVHHDNNSFGDEYRWELMFDSVVDAVKQEGAYESQKA